MLYYCLINTFPVYCGIPYFNITPTPIDDGSVCNKRDWYAPDQRPDAISIASGKYVSNFTIPSDPTQVIILTADAPNTDHTIMRKNLDTPQRKEYTALSAIMRNML